MRQTYEKRTSCERARILTYTHSQKWISFQVFLRERHVPKAHVLRVRAHLNVRVPECTEKIGHLNVRARANFGFGFTCAACKSCKSCGRARILMYAYLHWTHKTFDSLTNAHAPKLDLFFLFRFLLRARAVCETHTPGGRARAHLDVKVP